MVIIAMDMFQTMLQDMWQAQNAQLTAQLSQNAQTQTLINTLRPVASPAYITCSPYESAYGTRNGGCGCGCGC